MPFWDSRDEFGDTNLLVRTPEEGASLARTWAPFHGAAAPPRRDPVGRSMRECVFRSIYTTHNAELQLRAMAIGTPGPLTPGETEKTGGHNMGTRGIERAWEYWSVRLQKAEAIGRRAACRWSPAAGCRAATRGRRQARQARAGACAAQGEGGQAQVALAALHVALTAGPDCRCLHGYVPALPGSAARGGVARAGVTP